MTTPMASKKLASLRLDDDLMSRIDNLIEVMYADLPVAPSRNAVMESWITSALAQAEAKYGGQFEILDLVNERHANKDTDS